MSILGSLEFPPVSQLLEWKNLFGSGAVGFNKIALVNVLSAVCTLVFFLVAASKKGLVPKGIQNIAEAGAGFVEHSIAEESIGHHDAKRYSSFLTALFFFIFFNNIFGVIPFFQMPATARMAVPAVLAIMVWVTFLFAGVKSQGLGHYVKNTVFPPGVPKALYVIVTPIEFFSTFIVRPISLAVRLFANVLAGHMLLVTFGVLTHTLITAHTLALKPIAILPFLMLVVMTGFEIGVAFLQAYIFTLLTAVFIGGALHPEH